MGLNSHFDNVFEAVEISMFRRKAFGIKSKWQLFAILRPYWIKKREELPAFFRVLAKTNKDNAGEMWDFGFKWRSLGHSRRRAPEDLVPEKHA